MPSAEIVAVGTEILLGDIVDTNSQALGRAFAEFGIIHRRRATVGDHLERCAAAISEALARSDMVVTIGGLGPTGDDLTRNAIAHAVGEPLVVDPEFLETLKAFVAARGRPWLDVYEVQAMRPSTASLLQNDVGTAPGIHWHKDGKRVIAMPGPRGEFLSMLEMSVRPILASMSDSVIHSRTLRILGMPEAELAEMFAAELEGENPTVSPYAKVGEVHLRVTARGKDVESATKVIEPVAQKILERLGNKVYSSNGDSLSQTVLKLLESSAKTVAVAESCTGGMLGEALTSPPGASKAFLGGAITYSNEAKSTLLGVPPEIIAEFGAVSRETCEAMARGAREALEADFGVAITGIAGPDGGSAEKPVGLVYAGVSAAGSAKVEEFRFRGGRDYIRECAVQRALGLLYQEVV